MVTLVSGVIALILGILGLYRWWQEFIVVLQAAIPLILILGGALATYLGIEEWKDSQALSEPEPYSAAEAEAERYKAEAERLKAELEAAKQGQGAEKPEGDAPESA